MNDLIQIYKKIVSYVNSFPKINPYAPNNMQNVNYYGQKPISNVNINQNYPLVQNYQGPMTPTKQRINDINKEYFETIKKILFKEI